MGGEARNGIHFIENDAALRRQEQVHPGKHPAAQCPVDGSGSLLNRSGLFRCNAGGAVDGRSLEGVFFLIIKKSLGSIIFVF